LHPNHRKIPYAILPDIHTFNFPVGEQTINDSGMFTSAKTIFEIKTYTACPSRYIYNISTTKPLDHRKKEVVSSHNRMFNNWTNHLQLAEYVVGEGTNDSIGPFQAAQGYFYYRQAIPICTG